MSFQLPRCPNIDHFGYCHRKDCWCNVGGPCEWMSDVIVVRTSNNTTETTETDEPARTKRLLG